jgi:ubiquinone/menaquinone biosynthesis C-methylase UbiE
MPSIQQQTVQEQFTRTAEAFAVYAQRDTPDVLGERLGFAELTPDQAVLDVACGPGAFVLAAAPHVRLARGLDLTEEMLRQACVFRQTRGITNAGFDRGEGEHLPYASESFDLVSCHFAFHHLPDPETTFGEMLRVTKPSGRLFVADSLAPEDEARADLRNRIERLRDPSHTRALSLTALRGIFARSGLRIARQDIRDRVRSFNQWMRRAGLEPPDARYQATRQALEESIPGDQAGFSPRASSDDLKIIHREGMFLVARAGS